MYNLISDSNPEGPGGVFVTTCQQRASLKLRTCLAAATWSSIRNTPGFKNHTSLFPIILSAGRAKGDIAIDLDSPLYESTPFTFSTNLPSSGGLSVPMEYLGTHFDKGVPSSTACIKGFDSAGFVRIRFPSLNEYGAKSLSPAACSWHARAPRLEFRRKWSPRTSGCELCSTTPS